jgi:uncharacterized membrane protein YeaQ/YmgE (transglycosylase-associated protein family)
VAFVLAVFKLFPRRTIMGTIGSVISWLVFGLIVGAIARLLLPGRQEMGWLMTIALGIVGSVLGGAISWLVFGTPNDAINPAGWIMSIIGGILVLAIYGKMKGARRVG